jgi:hypothetical protein
LHPTLQFLNRPLSFLLFSISSLMFWLISVLFQITYENKNLFQFYPHLNFFTSFSFYLVHDLLADISFIWNNSWKLNFFSISSSFDFLNLSYLVHFLLISIYVIWWFHLRSFFFPINFFSYSFDFFYFTKFFSFVFFYTQIYFSTLSWFEFKLLS